MAAPKIQADYNGLREIAQAFSQNSDRLGAMNQRLVAMVGNEIRGKGWIGKGADNFIREMETLVFPAMERLLRALADAASATQKVAQVLEQAEQEGGSLFKGGESFNSIADNIIGNLAERNPSFKSIANGIINGINGGAGAGSAGSAAGGGAGGRGGAGNLLDSILRGTGGLGTNFGSVVDNIINGINGLFGGGKQPTFNDLANTIIENLGSSTSGGGAFNDIANSIIGNLRGSMGAGAGPFNQLADAMIAAMGGGGDPAGGASGGGGGGGGGGNPAGGGGGTGGTTGALSEALGRMEKMDQMRAALRDAVSKISGMSAAELGASIGGVLAGKPGMAVGHAAGSAIGAALSGAAGSAGEAAESLDSL